MSKVSETVTVPFALGGTAVSGTDYTGVTAGPLTFGIGQTTQNITGTLLSDPGPNQTLTLTLGTPTGGFVLGGPSVNTLTITEPATVQFATGSETESASAGTFSIPVTLAVGPKVSTFASGFNNPDGKPTGLAFEAGNLYVADTANGAVSEVTPAGNVSTFRHRVQRSRCPGLRLGRQPLRRQHRQRHGEQGDARGRRQPLRHGAQRLRSAWPSTRPATSTSPTPATAP